VFATNAGSAAGVEGAAAALAAASISSSSSKAAAAPVHEALACGAGEVQCASFYGSWLEHFTVSASPALRRAAAAKAPQKSGKGAASAASAAADSGELRLWELGVHCGHDFINNAAPLPSDAVYRADVVALAAQNVPLAQTEKVRLENEQRADAKLRKAHGGGH
jgi:hypothetical protein